VIISFGTALLVPISSTVVSYLAPEHLRGRYMGAWTLVWTGGIALGPIFGGLAMDHLGGRGAYAIVLAAGLTGAALYVLLGLRGWVLPRGPTSAR
jgi:MFS family permease